MGFLILFLTLEVKFTVFIIEYDVDCGFVINSFYYVKIYFLYTHFVDFFNHKCMLNFVKWFFCIYWDDHMIFFLHFIMLSAVSNFQDLMPDDLKWNWYNSNGNKVHNKCNVLESFSNQPSHPGKLSSMKLVTGAKKVGDHCGTSQWLICVFGTIPMSLE